MRGYARMASGCSGDYYSVLRENAGVRFKGKCLFLTSQTWQEQISYACQLFSVESNLPINLTYYSVFFTPAVKSERFTMDSISLTCLLVFDMLIFRLLCCRLKKADVSW